MSNTDANYKFFTFCYVNKEFAQGGKVMFQILSPIFQNDTPLDFTWQYKFSELLQFLHQTQFVFDIPDSFYDMLTNIAIQIKGNPNVNWKALLN